MKSFQDFLEDGEVSVGGSTAPSTNTTAGIPQVPLPLVRTKKVGNYTDAVIPHTDWQKIKANLNEIDNSTDNWVGERVDPLVADALRKAIDAEDKLFVTSDKTHATAVVRHKWLQRMKAADDIAMSQ